MDQTAVERASTGEPEWRTAERQTAFEYFEKLDMPSNEEVWKYVELDLDLDDYGLVATPGESGDAGFAGFDPTHRVVIVDGITTTVDTPAGAGVWVGSLRSAVTDRTDAFRRIEAHGIPSDLDKFAAAHRAFGGDGALVHVGRGVVSEPVLVEVHAATADAISFPRVVIVAEPTSEASVIVHAKSPEGLRALVIPQIEIIADQATNVSVSVVQNHGRGVQSLGHARAHVDRDATLTFAEAGLGSSLSRLHLTVDLMGRGANGKVVGAYFGDRDQVLDYRYFMHHAGLNTSSDMFLKGAVEDEALSVFTGMIRIDEDAQRTDAYQTNRNLILSDGAAAQSVPNLEILANDVKCGHGSTMGPLDEEQRYYLMSRGLDSDQADRLQVRGFFEEALGRFPHEQVKGPLRQWMNAKFISAQKEGRL